jgi:hypothetical protein
MVLYLLEEPFIYRVVVNGNAVPSADLIRIPRSSRESVHTYQQDVET